MIGKFWRVDMFFFLARIHFDADLKETLRSEDLLVYWLLKQPNCLN